MSATELESLYHRAVADPSSITRAEKNSILGWPEPEQEDRLFNAKIGGTRKDLITKANTRPQELTSYEVDVILYSDGITLEKDAPPGSYVRPKRSPLHNKAASAVHSVDPEEKQAMLAASLQMRALARMRREEVERIVAENNLQHRLMRGTPWMQEMLAKGLLGDDRECWGFVCFQTGCYEENGNNTGAWKRFQDYFVDTGDKVVMNWNSGPLMWPAFRVVWVSDMALDGASTQTLRQRFGEMTLPPGIRTNCFLVADASTIMSEGTSIPFNTASLRSLPRLEWPTVYLRAVHPHYDEAQADADGEMAGFTGEVTIALPKVFDYLHCACFSEQNLVHWTDHRLRKGWNSIYNSTKEPGQWKILSGNSGGMVY